MKKSKYTFKRWFMHWCAFQITALKLNCWKFKFLFHDIDKPFLKFFFNDKKVSYIHKKYSSHHVEYYRKKYDYNEMIVDWECSSLTKPEAPLDAKGTFREIFYNKVSDEFDKNVEYLLMKLF